MSARVFWHIPSIALIGCMGAGQPADDDARVRLTMAPLSLPEVGVVCYDVAVSTPGGAVWTRGDPARTALGHDQAAPPDATLPPASPADVTTVCSDLFGNGPGGGVAYVGPCDASAAADTVPGGAVQNRVTIWVDGVYAAGRSAELGDWQDPCPNGCSLDVDCRANADASAEFDLTILRRAYQGFFDIAVNFDDVFCAAKFDTCDGAEPITLLHGAGPERDWTGVFGFACTAGTAPETSTTLYYGEITVDCGAAGSFVIDPTAGPGTVEATSGGATLHYGVYRGGEALDCGDGPGSCHKLYWNLAFSLDDLRALDAECVLSLSATAGGGDRPFVAGLPGGDGLLYPYLELVTTLTVGATPPATLGSGVCQTHALDGDDAVLSTQYLGFLAGVLPPTPMCHHFDGVTADTTGATSGCANETPVCDDGYAWDGTACVDVDECEQGSTCDPATSECVNLEPGYECQCLDGYVSEDDLTCVDRDECLDGDFECAFDEYCENTEGGYDCVYCGDGYESDGYTCFDIDECDTGDFACDTTEYCENTEGGYDCVYCGDGYESDGYTCFDIDECDTGDFACDTTEYCENTEGGYDCVYCGDGYESDGYTCFDIDECDLGLHDCDAVATCYNGEGSFSCECPADFDDVNGDGTYCECPEGYTQSGESCQDVDECDEGTHGCDTNDVCHNDDGSYWCEPCDEGYEPGAGACVDIDECDLGSHDCDAVATCYNDEGSFSCECPADFDDVNGDGTYCECPEGYTQNGESCEDVDECDEGTHDCDANDVCHNEDGSYWCEPCDEGYEPGAGACVDIDECDLGSHDCDAVATCYNDEGGFSCECPADFDDVNGDGTYCECPEGYTQNGESCEDVDECAEGSDGCDTNDLCHNDEGSYWCEPCGPGYEPGDGECVEVDPCPPAWQGLPPTFDGGDGSAQTPYLVSDATQLRYLSRSPSLWTSHFRLTANIDLAGESWYPIGNTECVDAFYGSFDGDGYTLSNMTVDSPSSDRVGMFATVVGDPAIGPGAIMDLTLASVNMVGRYNVGALAGVVLGQATVTDVTVLDGNIVGSQYVGGLIAFADRHLEGDPAQPELASGPIVTGCSVVAAVSGTSSVGGLVGLLGDGSPVTQGWAATLVDSHAQVDIESGSPTSSGNGVGGLVGQEYAGEIDGCTASGTISMPWGLGVGGLVGYMNGGVVRASSADVPITIVKGQEVGGLIGDTYGDALIQASLAIGAVSVGQSQNIPHDGPTNAVGGLVGSLRLSTIESSVATGPVAGFGAVGGLVGSSAGGTIDDSHASGSVDRAGNAPGSTNLGGLLGDTWTTLPTAVARCSATGDVGHGPHGLVAGTFAGGLVGRFGYGSVVDSFATGDVRSSGTAGGLVGTLDPTGAIDRAYASGEVTSSDTIGGLVGSNAGHIADSFAVGVMNPTSGSPQQLVGGLIGATYNVWDVDNCAYLDPGATPLPCSGTQTGGFLSGAGCDLRTDASWFFDEANPPLSSWDFTTVWQALVGSLPILQP